MAKRKEEEMVWSKAKMAEHKMWAGVGIFIFGLVLWWTFQTYGTLRWDIAFMVAGILMVLKGLYMKGGLKL